jgi:hypothetical protein
MIRRYGIQSPFFIYDSNATCILILCHAIIGTVRV